MTKYSVDILQHENWESIALFSDKCSISAMIDFCVYQFENGNSLSCPCDDIRILDLTNAEIVFQYNDFFDMHEYWDDEVSYWNDTFDANRVTEMFEEEII